ncbi:MAG: cytochrome c3 family protein [candidate division Zixibacteria bacterium]|nr:cytochrome c3 family protein [candidate division Zixibacteria bacterium]
MEYDSIPAPMADLGCKSCHLEIAFQQTTRIVRSACVNCHEKDYILILEEQQQEIKKRMQEVRDFVSHFKREKKPSSEQQRR